MTHYSTNDPSARATIQWALNLHIIENKALYRECPDQLRDLVAAAEALNIHGLTDEEEHGPSESTAEQLSLL